MQCLKRHPFRDPHHRPLHRSREKQRDHGALRWLDLRTIERIREQRGGILALQCDPSRTIDHRRTVDEQDAPMTMVRARGDIGECSAQEHLDRIVDLRRSNGSLLGGIGVGVLHDLGEQGRLVCPVVIDRSPADAGRPRDIDDGDGVKAALGEQHGRRGQQCHPGALGGVSCGTRHAELSHPERLYVHSVRKAFVVPHAGKVGAVER